MTTDAPTLLDAFNAAAAALAPSSEPAEDLRTAINRFTDALASFVAAPLADGSVPLSKLANVNSGTVFYRKTASAGVPQVQTLATLKTDLGVITALRYWSFDGVDGSGVEPDLGCTLLGAEIGDVVAGILDITDFDDYSEDFESAITVADKIQQISLADLSSKTFVVLLARK